MLRIFFFLVLVTGSAQAQIDSSSTIFFPDEFSQAFSNYQSAAITRWNFLFYDSEKISEQEICEQISTTDKDDYIFNPCWELPLSPRFLEMWSSKKMLSQAPPMDLKSFKKQLDRAIVKLSLPLPTTSLDLIHKNPLAQFQDMSQAFENFYDSPELSERWQVLAFLLKFPTESFEKTETLNKSVSGSAHWVGPHFGQMINRQRIEKDVKSVAWLATLFVSSLIFFLIFIRRYHYLLLIPTLLISGGIAFLVTLKVWGSVHGLTLAFGSGLIGISMDYAFHGWNRKFDSLAWKSNTISFATTLLSFLLVGLLSPPLVKQLSLFASIGLSFAFVLSYLTARFLLRFFPTLEFSIHPPKYSLKMMLPLFGSMFLIGLGAFVSVEKDFTLKQMDYAHTSMPVGLQSHKSIEKKSNYAFHVNRLGASERQDISQFARENQVPYIGQSIIYGTDSLRQQYQKQWTELVCDQSGAWNKIKDQPPYSNIFKNFFKTVTCASIKSVIQGTSEQGLFMSDSGSITILKPQNQNQANLIRRQFPKTFFLSKVTEEFPKVLRHEISLFFGSIFVITFVFLSLFFRKMAFLCLLPALGGASSFFIFRLLTGLPMTFMNFVGLLVLFGLTLDFGIFCCSFIRGGRNLNKALGSISVASFTSFAGFSPLIFCSHPVLFDLGSTITIGLMGALLTTFLLYPSIQKSDMAL